MGTNLEDILIKYKSGRREDLIPLLQEIQEVIGYLSEEAIVNVGSHLGLSTTKIYGLATFYDQFRFFPSGKIRIRVCNGTSCFLNGSQAVIAGLREETATEAGQTSRNGNFSLELVSCMGGCQKGPVVCVNGEYYTHVKPEQIPDMVKKLKYILEND
ncbi:MAG: NAD(P)H-dependent oxidoreductase subunit E [Bacteroidales bacterium]|jgi:NADH-quinone oxidoreductase subunit E|nr:NAD(P)H-dependent oxidoreductase subunit E [Bacteroidales bacterium]